jgi:hypothetical protein
MNESTTLGFILRTMHQMEICVNRIQWDQSDDGDVRAGGGAGGMMNNGSLKMLLCCM